MTCRIGNWRELGARDETGAINRSHMKGPLQCVIEFEIHP